MKLWSSTKPGVSFEQLLDRHPHMPLRRVCWALVVLSACSGELTPAVEVPTSPVGLHDGGEVDSGIDGRDAGSHDGGRTDAGAADSGGVDASADDAGSADGGGFDAGPTESNEPPVTATFVGMPLSSPLPNPERGWAAWSGSDFVTAWDSGSVTAAHNQGRRLLSCVSSLATFRTQPLSDAWLQQLDAAFGRVRSAGMKCVVWFFYDFTSAGNDATATQIAAHASQLAPVLQRNADAIAYVKAGFIGAWGEWHSSQHQNSCGFQSGGTPCGVAEANRLSVRDALLAAFPQTAFVQFRHPTDLRRWYPTVLTSAQAFDGSVQSRVGPHNDCFLSGATDTGTYDTDPTKGAAERAYIEAVTNFTPYGGENAADCEQPHRTSCADVMGDAARFHLAWFKGPSSDITDWTNAWAAGGCASAVDNLMGYRLQLDSVRHQGAATAGQTITVEVSLRNLGWARLFSTRALEVVLVRENQKVSASSPTLLRMLPPQASASTVSSVHLRLPPDAARGAWGVFVQAHDVWPSTTNLPDFAVRFANGDDAGAGQRWLPSEARFATGTTVLVK
jgi:Domain of unknown function (DUF4832)/Domain of unknown function (DUF4874)